MQHTNTLHPRASDAPTVAARVTPSPRMTVMTLVLADGSDRHEIMTSDPAVAREYFAALEAAAHELVIAANQALAPKAVPA